MIILNSKSVNSKSQRSENNSKLLTLHSIYPHTLTLTLTLETPINRAFQPKSEGVRVKKEKNFFLLYCCLNGENPLSEAMGYTVLGGIASLTPSAFPESATGRALTAGNVRE